MSRNTDAPTRRITNNLFNRNRDNNVHNVFDDINTDTSFDPTSIQRETTTTHLDAGVTKLVRPGREASEIQKDYMDDPVVGWLVVVAGPGKGISIPIGYGMNPIGRSESQRIRLDFGDAEISRESHAILSYDQRGRVFYIQHGGGKNLTYIENAQTLSPVLVPTILTNNQKIHLGGETVLHFISFCSPNFDWADTLQNTTP